MCRLHINAAIVHDCVWYYQGAQCIKGTIRATEQTLRDPAIQWLRRRWSAINRNTLDLILKMQFQPSYNFSVETKARWQFLQENRMINGVKTPLISPGSNTRTTHRFCQLTVTLRSSPALGQSRNCDFFCKLTGNAHEDHYFEVR